MRYGRSAKKSGRSKGYRPRVEALEPKRCLSASLPHVAPKVATVVAPHVTTPAASIVQVGTTLRITDPTGGDTIAVTDNGTGGVTAAITNTSTTASVVDSVSFTGITRVIIISTGGDEILDYTLTGALAQAERIQATLTKGGNTADFELPDGVSGASLYLDVNASGGDNNVTENFGGVTSSKIFDSTYVTGGGNMVTEDLTDADAAVLSSSKVYLGIDGSGGDNTLASTVTGDLTASTLLFDIHGSGGLNNVSATVTGDIDGTSTVGGSVGADGGGCGRSSSAGGDTVLFNYDGNVSGTLGVGVNGSGNDETLITTIVIEADSAATGKVFAVETVSHHGTTPDTLTFNVTDDTAVSGVTGLAKLDAKIVDYLASTDLITNTSNVTIDSTPPWKS
jgi:hypothetical protein